MHIFSIPFIFIGMVLIINAIWLQGKVDTKDVGVFNILTGVLAALGSLYYGTVQQNFALGCGGMLFAMTYLWVGINAIRGATDQRALGYYCLLVAVMTVPFAFVAYSGGLLGWSVEWLSYGLLWFLFFMVLTLQNTSVMRLTIVLTYLVGIEVLLTGWLFLYDWNQPTAQALRLAAVG